MKQQKGTVDKFIMRKPFVMGWVCLNILQDINLLVKQATVFRRPMPSYLVQLKLINH